MTRYIDADALKEWINKASMQTDSFALVTAFGTLNYLIDNFTTIDAIPIEYMRSQIDCGKWEEIITRWKEHDKTN